MAIAAKDGGFIYSAEWASVQAFEFGEIAEADIDLNTWELNYPYVENGSTYTMSLELINNGSQDLTPYFLTANHCLGGNNSWIFMFNYESPTCSNQNGPTNMTVSGSSLLVNSSSSDVALLLLNETPPESYNVHYAGWDVSGNIPNIPVSLLVNP